MVFGNWRELDAAEALLPRRLAQQRCAADLFEDGTEGPGETVHHHNHVSSSCVCARDDESRWDPPSDRCVDPAGEAALISANAASSY